MKKARELRDLSIDELQARYLESNRMLFDLIGESKAQKKVAKPHLKKQTKREIARMLTIINEKQRAGH